MAIPAPLVSHSTANDNDSGTANHLAWQDLSRALLGQRDNSGRPNDPYILFSLPDDDNIDATLLDITNWTERTDTQANPVVVQLGPGEYDASNFKFHGFSDVVVRGVGPATRIIATPSAATPDGSRFPDSVNFSNCTRCGIENMDIIFEDDGTELTQNQACIQRAANAGTSTGLDGCWIKNVNFYITGLSASRTAAGATITAMAALTKPTGTTPGTNFTEAWTCKVTDCNIISENGGVQGLTGEWHFENCNIWFGTSQNANTPLVVGIEWSTFMRMYWRGGMITCGYQTQNPNSDRAVYCIRCDDSDANGRLFLYNAVMFAHNDGTGTSTRAIYFGTNAGTVASNYPWLRATGCYMHAEDADGSLHHPAVQIADFDPSTDTPTNKLAVQLDYNIRVAGVEGNAFGFDGRLFIDDHNYSVVHSTHSVLYVNPSTTTRTITMHGTDEVDNDVHKVKNIHGTNSVTIAVASGHYMNGTLNGTYSLTAGNAVEVRGRQSSGGVIYWETW